MRIGIYGAGAIGCYLGGRLAAVGCDVTFLCRPSMLHILNQEGLKLTDYKGVNQHIPASALKLTSSPEDLSNLDVIFICVKSAATEAVAYELNNILTSHSPIIISFQNSVSNVPILKRILTKHHVLEGMVPFNVAMPQPGHFHQGTEGTLAVKTFEGQTALQAAFQQAGLNIQFASDMLSIQWAKILLNLNNSINALSGRPLKEQLSIRAYRQCLAMAQTETLALLKLAQIKPAKLTALPADKIPHVLNLPNFLFKILSAKMLKIDPLARSSMLDDLAEGRITEIDWINGEVVNLANHLGQKAPINEHLMVLIKHAEQSHSHQVIEATALKSALQHVLST